MINWKTELARFHAWVKHRASGCMDDKEVANLLIGGLDNCVGGFSFQDDGVQAQWDAWQAALVWDQEEISDQEELLPVHFREAIEQTMAEFDFTQVNRIMIATNWGWSYPRVDSKLIDAIDINGDMREDDFDYIPNIQQLRRTARELLVRTCLEDHGGVGTGGFMCRLTDGRLELTFNAASTIVYTNSEDDD